MYLLCFFRSPGTKCSGTSILDCIFDNKTSTFYIIDLLIYKDTIHLHSTTDLRFYWIEQHILNDEILKKKTASNEYMFSCPNIYSCSLEGLRKAYYEKTPYLKDGLLFYHKEAGYEQGLNPYILIWKDASTSLYPIETDDGMINSDIKVVLELDEYGKLHTLEKIYIGEVDKDTLVKNKWYAGNLIRVTLTYFKLNEMADDIKNSFEFEGIKDFKRSSAQRVVPDSISKIIYQYMMRYGPLAFNDLCSAVEACQKEAEKDLDILI